MKSILLTCAIILLVGGAHLYRGLNAPQVYGAAFKVAEKTDLSAVLAEPDRYSSADIHVTGRIVRQCPSAGCWFYLDDGQGKRLKVELGHLGMKFPQKVGKLAEVEGRLLKSEKQLELVGNGVRFE